MRKLLLILSLFIQIESFAQSRFFYQDFFDSAAGLTVIIDTSIANNLWQIAEVDKFNFTSNQGKAIMTDSVNNYPSGNTSVAHFQIHVDSFYYGWPFFIFDWVQHHYMDTGLAGGWFEVSYDSGITWTNIFEDTIVPVQYMGQENIGLISNGKIGYTGTGINFFPWSYEGFCWSSNFMQPIIGDGTIMFKMIFWSDSLSTNQPGWVLDNFRFYASIVESLAPFSSHQYKYQNVYPNPVKDYINIPGLLNQSQIKILNLNGEVVLTKETDTDASIDIQSLSNGIYIIEIINDDQVIRKKFIKSD